MVERPRPVACITVGKRANRRGGWILGDVAKAGLFMRVTTSAAGTTIDDAGRYADDDIHRLIIANGRSTPFRRSAMPSRWISRHIKQGSEKPAYSSTALRRMATRIAVAVCTCPSAARRSSRDSGVGAGRVPLEQRRRGGNWPRYLDAQFGELANAEVADVLRQQVDGLGVRIVLYQFVKDQREKISSSSSAPSWPSARRR